jgi:hypothetical protein
MKRMLQTGLEFAPGTTDDCKRLIAGLFQPGEILGAYRQARGVFKTGDLVMVVAKSDPSGFNVEPRIAYLKRLRQVLGHHAASTMPALGINDKSAHSVMKLPFETDAMWLIVTRGQELPVMCVLYSTPYETTAVASPN